MIMNILVTGSMGEIGSALTKELVSRGHNVYGCDLHQRADEYTKTTSPITLNSKYFQCDIIEYRQLTRMFDAVDDINIVYNCAAGCGRWGGEEFYESMWNTNLVGLKNILDFQTRLRFQLVHFSTSEIYGDYGGILTESITETHSVFPYSDYAITKLANEMQIRNNRLYHATQSVIVRPFNIFGIGERFSPYRSYISKFIYCCIKGLPFVVYPKHYRSITYLDDAVRAIANISNNFIDGETYNISGDYYYSVLEVAEKIIKLSEAKSELMQIKEGFEPMTVICKQADNSKAKRDLRYVDSLSFEDALGRVIEWARIIL